MLQIVIPRKPLSVNHIYGQTRYGRKYLKKYAVDFKKEVEVIMRGKFLDYDERKHIIEIEYYFYLKDLFTRKGTINKRLGDADNFKKLVQDSVFKCLGIDDSAICKDLTLKLPSNEDAIVIIVRTAGFSSFMSP